MPQIPGSSRISASSEGARIAIVPARGAADIDAARELFREYREFLGPEVEIPGYEDEVASLPGYYAPPKGEILLARNASGEVLGCVALRPLADGDGEVKRLYLRDAARGRGLGKSLVLSIEAEARRIGYPVLKLDTVPWLTAAVTLYHSLGFADVERYNDNPTCGVLFMAKRLDPWSIAPARGPRDVDAFRALCRDYGDSIKGIALLTGFAEELAALPGPYAPPRGEILLARDPGGAVIGCVALRPLPDGTAETKRLYVVPAFRRRGLGRALMVALMNAARELGYSEIRLDFIPSMVEGHALYRALGFVEIERYNQNPNPSLVFMSKRL